jgi:hypothetical protein
MTSSAADDAAVAGASMADALRAAGIAVTEDGKRRWRERLRESIPDEALTEGRRARSEARGDAA